MKVKMISLCRKAYVSCRKYVGTSLRAGLGLKQGGTAVYPSLAVIAEDVFILERGIIVDTRRRWRMMMETELEI